MAMKHDHFERYIPIRMSRFKASKWADYYDYRIEYYDADGYAAIILRYSGVRDEMEAYTKAQAWLDKLKQQQTNP